MNTNQKGNIALGKAIEYFTSKGIIVSIPLTDSQTYDLIVDIQGTLFKVQTKYTDHKNLNNRSYMVGLRTVTRKSRASIISKSFKLHDFDLLFINTSDGDMYLIPIIDIFVSNAITLTDEWKEKYKAE